MHSTARLGTMMVALLVFGADAGAEDRSFEEVGLYWKARFQERWGKRKEKLIARFRELEESTQYRHVVYSPEEGSLQAVDFERGTVEVAVIASRDRLGERREELRRRLRALLLAEPATSREPSLREQLAGARSSDSGDVEQLIDLLEASADERLVEDRDGHLAVERRVHLDLMPEHRQVRAGAYRPLAKTYAAKYGVPLALVMAVMETESAFNPDAVSPKNAQGLMQIVPESGGIDAWERAFGKRRAPTPAELRDPRVNVELGVAYLRILEDTFRPATADPAKLQILCIAAYNGGPGRVQGVIAGRNIDRMSRGELLTLLQGRLPSETKDYIAMVSDRVGRHQEG